MHYSPTDLDVHWESPLAQHFTSIGHLCSYTAGAAWEEVHNKTLMIDKSPAGLDTNHHLQIYPLDLGEAKQ